MRFHNDNLIVIDLRSDKLIETLRNAINKGQEVCVTNFERDYDERVKVKKSVNLF